MTLITESYRALNRELHDRGIGYGASGHRWATAVNGVMRAGGYTSLLDYGCGMGTLCKALPSLWLDAYQLNEYDPAIPGKDAAPESADLVVCSDVLEHIERDCLDDVLDHLRDLTRKAAFLIIATVPAKKILSDGRNAHLLVEHPHWWLPKITARWDLHRFERDDKSFAAFVKAKP
jgi:2-polyprenyl-3-methyl-5-hydroxy-6-metoxy-1,4-benzoquinol methylase